MGKKIVNIVIIKVSLNTAIFYCQKENLWGKGRPALRGQLTQTDTALQLCRILLRLRFSILLFHFCIFWYYLSRLDREAKIVLTFIILTNCCRVGDPLDNEDGEKKGVYLPLKFTLIESLPAIFFIHHNPPILITAIISKKWWEHTYCFWP